MKNCRERRGAIRIPVGSGQPAGSCGHRWLLVAALLVSLAGLRAVWATPASESVASTASSTPQGAEIADTAADAQWETVSIRMLMQQDLDAALRQEAAGSDVGRAPTSPGATPVQAVLAPRLVALYGLGRALMAEVQVGRQAYLYVRDQPYPAGHQGDPDVYQLRGMSGACVQLARGQDQHSLCLRMLLGEVRP